MTKNRKGIWITGASKGIGKSIVLEFAKYGYHIFASSRDSQNLINLKNEIVFDNSIIDIFPCNVASFLEVENTFNKIILYDNLDCLINNAGITNFKLAEENSINQITDIINTNLLGSIYTIKNCLPYFIKKGSGTIINVLSVVTKKVYTKSSAYSAAKAGLLAYSNSLREEIRKYNIRVINIFPGATETSIWPNFILKQAKDRMMLPSDVAKVIISAYLQEGNSVLEEIVIKPITGDLS